jgi:hypothetical protein
VKRVKFLLRIIDIGFLLGTLIIFQNELKTWGLVLIGVCSMVSWLAGYFEGRIEEMEDQDR